MLQESFLPINQALQMQTLNESINVLPAHLAKAFLGVPEKKLLPAGTKLCKQVTAQANFNRLSEWWILRSDWDLQTKRAVAIAANSAQMVRAQQAVRNDWQPDLEQILHAQLLQPVYAWAGRARWQPLNSNDPKVMLIGGGMQICIPNLTTVHMRVLHSV